MFIDWISKVELLEHQPGTNILKDWPLDVRRAVCSEVVKYQVLQYASASQTLITPDHVKWVMECVGACFQLPIEHADVINLAIDLYSKWLFEPKRPAPIINDSQTFFRQFFRHFTFVFETRNAQGSQLNAHIALCNRVMDVFLQLGAAGDCMDEETWNELLLTLLGICDATIRGKKGLTELNYGLLKVLFEVWLCSLSYDIKMWDRLQKFGIFWAKSLCMVKQWNSLCISLTNRVVRLLYGPTEGTPVVHINWQELTPQFYPNENVANPVTELELPDEYVFYTWNFMLHIIGNPNLITDPEVYLEAFQGIAQISKIVAFIGTNVPESKNAKRPARMPYAPDGNTILHLLGSWFFEAVNRKSSNLNEGRAVAFAALCRIFCRKGGRAFTFTYYAKFYQALLTGLDEDDLMVVSAILLHSRKIFSYDLDGVHVLIPKYIQVCRKVLTVEPGVQNIYPEVLRAACATILSSLLCIPNHFSGLDSTPPYSGLKQQIFEILSRAILCEKDSTNLQHLLWCTGVFIHEHHLSDVPMTPTLVHATLKLIKQAGNADLQVLPEVYQTIFDMLSSLTSLKEQLHAGDSKLIPTLSSDLAHFVILQMNLFRNNKRQAPVVSRLVSDALYCLCDWLMAAYELVLISSERLYIILNAIETALNVEKFAKKPVSELSEIKDAAEYLLCHLINHAGHFPPAYAPNGQPYVNTSTDLVEDMLTADGEGGETSQYCRYFMFDDSFIFSVIEQPSKNQEASKVTILVRDVSGKHAWDASLLFGPKENTPVIFEATNPFTRATSKGLTGRTKELEENSQLLKLMAPRPYDNPEARGLDGIFNAIESQKQTEATTFEKPVDNRCLPVAAPNKYQSDVKFQLSRLLFSHLGFFNPDLQKRIFHLQYNHKLQRILKILDLSPHRECHKIGVVYVKEGQDSQEELFKNDMESDDFSQFLRDLGWMVELPTHAGFMGGLDRKLTTGKLAPYWADYKSEVIFHVPTMMPTKKGEDQQIHKKRHVGNDQINIIWTDHSREYRKSTISSHVNYVQIVIYPLKNGLYRIQVHRKDENVPLFGPLYDSMVVSRHVLGRLVRATAINGNRVVRTLQSGYTRPFITRKRHIRDVAQRNKDQMHFTPFVGSLFVSKQNLQALKVSQNQPERPIRSATVATTMPATSSATNLSTSPPQAQTEPLTPRSERKVTTLGTSKK